MSSLNLTRQFECAGDIANLGPFVAAAEENDNGIAAPDEIDAETGTVIDAHLRHATTRRLHVAGIAEGEAADANRNANPRLAIP